MPQKGNIQDRITGFWSAIAKGYEAHEGNVPARDTDEYREWERVIEELLPASPADVLDVATGTGFVAMIAAQLGHRVTGIDLAEPMLAEAKAEASRRGLKVTFQLDDAITPTLPAASFDAVTSRHLIWTLRDPPAALAAWKRLLRPGGRVIAIDGFFFEPLADGKSAEEGFFESFYDRDTRKRLPGWTYFDVDPIVRLFERAGFSNVTVRMLDEIQRMALHPPSTRPAYALLAFVP